MITINVAIVVVVRAVVRAVVRKGSWLNGFMYDIQESADIVNSKVFNQTDLVMTPSQQRPNVQLPGNLAVCSIE